MKCKCTQCPDLRQTGLGPPEADLYCPVCGTVFWSHDGKISKEKPKSVSSTKSTKKQTWEMKGGYWITV